MKQKDLPLLIVVAGVSVIFSIIISKVVISAPKNRQQKVYVVQKINNDFKMVDTRYFNSDSVDPTKLIKIGDNSNSDPFTR